jgi:hypothetical protein
MGLPRRLRSGLIALIVPVALAAVVYVTLRLRQPSAYEAAAEAARTRCREHGWPERLAARRYREEGFGWDEGFQQEFEIDGTAPRMAVWVEVRRPIYAPYWRVAEILEVEADVDPD